MIRRFSFTLLLILLVGLARFSDARAIYPRSTSSASSSSSSSFASAQHQQQPQHLSQHKYDTPEIAEHRCDTRDYKDSSDKGHEQMMADIMAGDIDIAQDIFFPVTIDIYFHIIDNEYVPSKSANMDNSTIDAQVRVLNKDFAHTGLFQFRLAGITRTKDPKIGKLKRGGVDESRLKNALHVGGSTTLNLFTAKLDGGQLGWATFPQDYKNDPVNDGVVVLYSSLPGGASTSFNLGRTATHEIGHWLGLYHVFQNVCSYPNDFVTDTPPQAGGSVGCPIGNKSCRIEDFMNVEDIDQYHQHDYLPEVVDSVTNFMDYSSDSCMTGFTEGQIERMRVHWALRLQQVSPTARR